jgi:hypothetical protein
LGEHIDTETSPVAERVREIARPSLQEVIGQAPVAGNEIEGDRFGLERSQLFDGGIDLDRHQFAEGLHLKCLVDRKVQVGDLLVVLQHLPEDVVEFVSSHKEGRGSDRRQISSSSGGVLRNWRNFFLSKHFS